MSSKKIIFIVGPTAVGKSDVAYLLAENLKAQVISCDSAQVYKEIDIACNKPSEDIQSRIPHHLINLVSVTDMFDVSQYHRLAIQAIGDIQARNQTVLVVGGTGLYMKILLDGILDGGAPNLDLRNKLWRKIELEGRLSMHQKLESLDPDSAKSIHPNDSKKIIRALEVYYQKGKPISQLKNNREGIWDQYDIKLFALNCQREKLYQKINTRVDFMFDNGLVDEIQRIQGLKLSQSAAGIIGVKEVIAYLSGEYDLERTKYLLKLNTRHYAKRQLTWFNKEQRLTWISTDQCTEKQQIVSEIIKEINS